MGSKDDLGMWVEGEEGEQGEQGEAVEEGED